MAYIGRIIIGRFNISSSKKSSLNYLLVTYKSSRSIYSDYSWDHEAVKHKQTKFLLNLFSFEHFEHESKSQFGLFL